MKRFVPQKNKNNIKSTPQEANKARAHSDSRMKFKPAQEPVIEEEPAELDYDKELRILEEAHRVIYDR